MTHRPKFRRLSREVLVENPWHRYCLDRYAQGDAGEGDYYYLDMPGSCAVIPFFADGSTALLRVERYLLGTWLWEFPIGGMREGEDPVEVAKRELREEAGILAERWARLGSFAPYKGASNEICHYFLAKGLSPCPRELEPSEDISVHRMPFAEARRRLIEQDLPDGQSLAGLLLLERHRSSSRPPG
ncbi:MAG: NUDIX domain-containing protein [Planctomycetota bacterium]